MARIRGKSGDDVLDGKDKEDWIYGFGGNDVLSGHGGNDLIVAPPNEETDEFDGTSRVNHHADSSIAFVHSL